VITISNSSVFLGGGAVSFTGVDQGTPVGTPATNNGFTEGTASTPSVDVSAAPNDVVVDMLWSTCCNVVAVGEGQTQQVNQNDGGTTGQTVAMSTKPGATTVTMSWTNASSAWCIAGVAVKPAAR